MKWVLLGCLILLSNCSLKEHIQGDWYCYNASIKDYEWLVFKGDKVIYMMPARDSRNYPKVIGSTGKYKIEDSNLIINWIDRPTQKGKFSSDTILVFDNKVYRKILK